MSDCLFCKIVAGTIPAKIVYQDEFAVAFDDIHPQAPTHTLVIPRKHVAAVQDCAPGDQAMMGGLLQACAAVAKMKGLSERGYRIVTNTGADAGQTVVHLHLHVLGGRHLTWPPG
ncbi:MAG: histidine triad nucleotide-binding protein [Nitrospiraceae bacterium]